MILSAQSIRVRCDNYEQMIIPFHERTIHNGMTYGLSAAGYDIRIAEDVYLSYPKYDKFVLASSMEYFNMPDDVLGRVADKSSWARKGLAVQNTVIEPGWKGYLTLELSYHGNASLEITKGTPIAQIIFELLDAPTEQPYRGKYQNQRAGAVEAIEETQQGHQ